MTRDSGVDPALKDERDEPLRKHLTPEAERALAEAQARRRAQNDARPPAEIGGRGGLDPVRFGDWEIKGVACDF